MNKQGSILDIAYILTMLFVFAFVTILMFNIYNAYKEDVAGNEAFNNTVNLQVEASATNTLQILDYVYVFFLVGFILLSIVSSFAIRSHPLFFFISLFMLIITVIIGSSLSNVYQDITTDTELSDETYTVIPFIMNHLPTFILMIGAILVIVLYAKSKWEEYG